MTTSRLVAERVPFCCNRLVSLRIVIGFGADRLASIERGLSSRIGRDGQVALSDIHPNDIFVRLRSGVSSLNLKGNQQ